MSTRAALFVIGAILFQMLWMGLAASLLSALLVIAYAVWLIRPLHASRSVYLTYLAGVCVFVLHVAEEFLTGFHREMPALLGFPEWTGRQFLTFNAVWLLIFVRAAIGLRTGEPLALLIALFFALAGGAGNGVAHLLLVMRAGGYFPGAWTASLCAIVGTGLLYLLFKPSPPGPTP